MSFPIKNKIKFSIRNLFSYNIYYFIFFIYFLRISYVIIFDNTSGDFSLYEKIAKGIASGCGFAIETSQGDCKPIIGHYFPGFFYFLSIFYFLNLKIKSFIILISSLQFLSNLNLFFTLKKYIKNSSLSNYILIILSLSPLTLGFTRILLIEPVITIFSTLFLSKLIQIFFEGFTKRNYLELIFLQIISIYFKPTAIIFSLPFIVFAFYKLNFFKIIQNLFIWFLTITIAISPWGFRNLEMGAEKPFTSVLSSNFFPENRNGYLNWYSTWIITEHEQAINGFPITKAPFNLYLKKARFNPFISQEELAIVQKKFDKISDFSSEDDYFFERQAKIRKDKLGFLGLTSLYTSKIISLLINPLNSWGWPLEIYSSLSDKTTSVAKSSLFYEIASKVNLQITLKVFLKFTLFIYRIILFTFFFKITLGNIFRRNLSFIKNRSLSNIISLSSLTFLLGTLYLIAIHFSSLEHRFISVVAPWIEISVFLHFRKINKLDKI